MDGCNKTRDRLFARSARSVSHCRGAGGARLIGVAGIKYGVGPHCARWMNLDSTMKYDAALVLALFFCVATPSRAADAIAGAGLFNEFCQSCHGPAQQNFNNVLLGANNAAAIQLQMQVPASDMAFLQDILSSDDIANVAAYLGTVAGVQPPATVPVIE